VATCRDLSNQALAAIEQGQWQHAEGLLGNAIETCPVDPDARRYYAEVLVQRGAIHEALAHLEEARRLVPHDTSLTIRAGELYLTTNQLAFAESRAAAAIRLDNKSADAWSLRARVRRAQGDNHGALADLQQALRHRPDDPLLLGEIAGLHLGMNRPDRALMHAQSLADTYVAGEVPIDIVQLQAQIYAATGRHAEAAACYRQICQRSAPSADHFYALAQAEMQAGNVVNAEAALRSALAIQPDHAPSRQLWPHVAQLRAQAGALR
jgi:predicted Zn-dependent protease